MQCCESFNNSVCQGTDLKINVHMEPVDGYRMQDIDFTVCFFCHTNRYVQLAKEELTAVDEDNYIACVDSRKLGLGMVYMEFAAEIPDTDFQTAVRREVVTIPTGIRILQRQGGGRWGA